jgi:hypothetical protein
MVQAIIGGLATLGILLAVCVMTRRLARTKPSQWLSDSEFPIHVERLRKIEHAATGVGIFFTVSCVWPIAFGLHWMNVAILDRRANPILDGRRWEWWLPCALVVTCAIAVFVVRFEGRRRSGDSPDLFDRFVATIHGFDLRKANALWAVMLIVICLPLGWLAWSNGVIIDERGVAIRLAWFSSFQTFGSIERIERSRSRLTGEQVVPVDDSLTIHFRSGKPHTLTIRPDGWTGPADLDRIEAFLLDKADVDANLSVDSNSINRRD